MSPDARGFLSRARAELIGAAAARYRAAVASGEDVRWVRVAAGGYLTLATTRRLAAQARGGLPQLADAAVTAVRRPHPDDALIVEHAAVGGVRSLSISLSGDADRCAAVRGLTLTSTTGTGPGRVPSRITRTGSSVRVVADLHPTIGQDGGDSWRIGLVDGHDATLPLAARSPRVVPRPSGTAAWPLRVDVDPARQLIISRDRRPATASLSSCRLGLTTLSVDWPFPDLAELRLVSPLGTVVAFGDGAPDRRSTTVELAELAALGPGVWLAEARIGAEWRPLGLEPGHYPRLDTAPEEITTVRAGNSTRWVSVGYSERNQLRVEVRP